MKLTATMVTMIVLCGVLPVCADAAEPNSADAKTSAPPRGASADKAIPALRSEIHQTRAALQEARSAQQPDAAKIAQLENSLRQLREQLVAQAGPGYGPGRGPGYGMGHGRGAGWGAGPGGGHGYRGGRGPGPGCGYGPGCGFGGGYGMGRGFGPGGGQGHAPGGPWFVDEDNDGVCDRFQQRNAAAK